MIKQIGIIGGDLRIIRLSEILSKEGYIIYTYALDKYNFLDKNILKCIKIEEIYNKCDYIISGIPFSQDGVYVNTPFTSEQIKINDLLKIIANKTLIAGGIKLDVKEKAIKDNVKIIDLLEFEELTILNIIPTVEGAIQIAIKQTEFTINNSKCLILGFGRIGKLLSKNLKGLGAKVYCMARKESDLAWIKTFGYNGIHIDNLEENLENRYDIIFNTIPTLILDSKKLELIKNKETLIIELASAPGGIDFEKAKEYGIKTVKALGLPGKVAPLTAAEYIKETLEKILK